MHTVRTLMALSAALLATACVSPGNTMAAPAASGMAAMEPRTKAMQEMHQKMVSAGTPAERQALMADRMPPAAGR